MPLQNPSLPLKYLLFSGTTTQISELMLVQISLNRIVVATAVAANVLLRKADVYSLRQQSRKAFSTLTVSKLVISNRIKLFRYWMCLNEPLALQHWIYRPHHDSHTFYEPGKLAEIDISCFNKFVAGSIRFVFDDLYDPYLEYQKLVVVVGSIVNSLISSWLP